MEMVPQIHLVLWSEFYSHTHLHLHVLNTGTNSPLPRPRGTHTQYNNFRSSLRFVRLERFIITKKHNTKSLFRNSAQSRPMIAGLC
jgi:hypothetical protein